MGETLLEGAKMTQGHLYHQSQTQTLVRAHKAQSLEHAAKQTVSSAAWGLSFPSASLGLSLLQTVQLLFFPQGSLVGFCFLQAVGIILKKKKKNNTHLRTRRLSHLIKVLTALPEDSSLNSTTHIRWLKITCKSSFGRYCTVSTTVGTHTRILIFTDTNHYE